MIEPLFGSFLRTDTIPLIPTLNLRRDLSALVGEGAILEFHGLRSSPAHPALILAFLLSLLLIDPRSQQCGHNIKDEACKTINH
jgi:hypothetical protein